MPERLEYEVLQKEYYISTLTFTFTIAASARLLGTVRVSITRKHFSLFSVCISFRCSFLRVSAFIYTE